MKKVLKFIALYRVSTKEQGESELGLKSQRDAVRAYVKSVGGILIKEFTEVYSAASKDVIKYGASINLDTLLRRRPILMEALQLAAQEGACIAVKEVSRLTRYKLLGEYLMATNVDFICTDAPNDSKLILSIKIALMEEEAAMISRRTSLALKKKVEEHDINEPWLIKREDGTTYEVYGKGWSLGNPSYTDGTLARIAREKKSQYSLINPNNKTAAAMICSLVKDGLTLQEMANYLNDNGFKTARGSSFKPMQVSRIVKRFCRAKAA